MSHLPIGMRYVKTALAVTLCVAISRTLNMEYPFYAAIAAVISMESTLYTSFKAGRNRMMGTLVGALIGMLFAMIQPNNALLCGLGIICIIYVCQTQKWKNAISIGCIVFLAIMINLEGKSPMMYSINRLEDTLLGIVIALAVNSLIVPYDGRKAIHNHYAKMMTLSEALKNCLLGKNRPSEECKELRKAFSKELEALKEQFRLYREEFPLHRDHKFDVVYRFKVFFDISPDRQVEEEAVEERLKLATEFMDHLIMLERLDNELGLEEEEATLRHPAVERYHADKAMLLVTSLMQPLKNES